MPNADSPRPQSSLSEDEWLAFIGRAFSPEYRQAAEQYVTRLCRASLPVVFDSGHLAQIVGLSDSTIRSMVAAQQKFYREFSIPKRRGGERTIQAPYPSILYVQRWINKAILRQIPVHESAHGFLRNRSVVSNAAPHIGQECVLKLDIKDFFPTIKLRRVIAVFLRAGYSAEVSYDLARICTLDGCLPQGAATSPAIANIVAAQLDCRLSGLAAKFSLRYTRYADDLTFSGRAVSVGLSRIVQRLVEAEGFLVNVEKTLLMRSSCKKIVTGISVSGSSAKVPREFRRTLRNEVFQVVRRGLEAHKEALDIRDPQYLQRLIGKVAYWRMVEPDSAAARAYLEQLLELQRNLAASVGRNDLTGQLSVD